MSAMHAAVADVPSFQVGAQKFVISGTFPYDSWKMNVTNRLSVQNTPLLSLDTHLPPSIVYIYYTNTNTIVYSVTAQTSHTYESTGASAPELVLAHQNYFFVIFSFKSCFARHWCVFPEEPWKQNRNCSVKQAISSVVDHLRKHWAWSHMSVIPLVETSMVVVFSMFSNLQKPLMPSLSSSSWKMARWTMVDTPPKTLGLESYDGGRRHLRSMST